MIMGKKSGISMGDEVVGIKDHSEKEMAPLECGNLKYLGGMDAGKYAEEQNNKLAQNIRKHRAP